jgi:DNA-directed RNA polymerase specialized sigma24 family protein
MATNIGMEKLVKEQYLLNGLYNKDPAITRQILPVFVSSVKIHLKQRGHYSKQLCDDLVMSTLVELYMKKEVPQLTVKAHSYLLGITKNIYLSRITRSKEDSIQNASFDRYEAIDDIIEQLEIEESKKLLNRLISKLSRRCQELLEKTLLEVKPEKICEEMHYASMSMYYKKKSQCLERLRDLGRKSSECCKHFSFD